MVTIEADVDADDILNDVVDEIGIDGVIEWLIDNHDESAINYMKESIKAYNEE